MMEPGMNPSIRRRASKRTANDGDHQARILGHYVLHTLRQVKKRLQRWEQEAKFCEDEELRKQALASIREKGFHSQGGAVFCRSKAGCASERDPFPGGSNAKRRLSNVNLRQQDLVARGSKKREIRRGGKS
jgi:hypothetical protein